MKFKQFQKEMLRNEVCDRIHVAFIVSKRDYDRAKPIMQILEDESWHKASWKRLEDNEIYFCYRVKKLYEERSHFFVEMKKAYKALRKAVIPVRLSAKWHERNFD